MSTRFTPISGIEANLDNVSIVNGQVLFATDTNKIYLDTNGERIMMGGSGNTNIYYGKRTISDGESTDTLIFTPAEIEGSKIPEVGDLILNIPDGSFYRVTEINGNEITTTQLTIAGSGGTGGGGGSGSADQTPSISSFDGIVSGSIFILGDSKNISITGSSPVDDKVKYYFKIVNTDTNITYTTTNSAYVANNEAYIYDMGSYLSSLGEGTYSITCYIISDNASYYGMKKFNSIVVTAMSITKSSNFNLLNVWNGTISFRCIANGVGLTKTIYIQVDGLTQSSLTKTGITTSGAEIAIDIPALSHGYHTITAILTNEDETAKTSYTCQIACIENGNNDPVIWLGEYPSTITNYESLIIPYMVYDPANPDQATINEYLNGELLASGTLENIAWSSTTWLNWKVVGYKVGTNLLSLSSGKTTLPFQVLVNEDTTRDLGIIKSGLVLNFDAEGRSNKENITSRQTYTYDYQNVTNAIKFNNFNWYNNGWIMDDDSNTCLRISNGSSIEIPLNVLNQDTLTTSYSFEFVFKLRNVQKYSSLIETSVVTDANGENAKVTKTVKSTDGVVISYYNNGVGFCLGTQEAFFKSTATTVSGKYKEDELMHVTFVVESPSVSSIPLMYMYINGLNSGIAAYGTSGDSFNTTSELNKITINSDFCDIDLYKLRIYDSNLTAENVVHNYIADYADVDLYDMNQIVEYNNNIPNISYDKMIAYNKEHPDNTLMPYCIIETNDINNVLPFIKKENDEDTWTVNLEFHNPMLDRAYENGDITDDEYLAGCPSFSTENASLNVQGTSSQGYPRRNYKAKLKSDYWTVTNTYLAGPQKGKTFKKLQVDSSIGETSFTWKADYMESSGSHNGGLASYLKLLYSKHPLQDYGISQADADPYRTTVYGFPMMVFHKKSGGTAGGAMQFIGRYCFLLDKSCKDSFGFTNKTASKSSITCKVTEDTTPSSTKTYYTISKKCYSAESGLSAWETEDDGSAITYYEKIDYDADSSNTLPLNLKSCTECWQMDQNQGGRCSMKLPVTTDESKKNKNYDDILNAEHLDDNKHRVLDITDDIEVRYHPDKDNIEYAIAKSNGFTDDAVAISYLKSRYSRVADLLSWVASTDTTAVTNEKLDTPYVVGDGENSVTYEYDNAEYRLAKFANEFNLHFDKEYCLVYYIITELLLCYDSRGKNMMIATWGPQVTGGYDIWYPIFYDMDTQLGINNSGVPYWDYYEEASTNGTFSTADSVLWLNLWSCFKADIKTKYNDLRGSKLNITNLNGYYDFDPNVSKTYSMQGDRPLIMKNIDEYFKYIDCATGSGYTDTTGKTGITTQTYFYCLQGDRQLQRSLFLRNRLNYIDSQWLAGDYSPEGVVSHQNRIDANDAVGLSDKYVARDLSETELASGYVKIDDSNINSDEVKNFNANWTFNLTPYLKQYMSVYFDELPTDLTYASDGQTVTITPTTKMKKRADEDVPVNQQLVYFGGMEYLSSLGDLSLKYPDKLDLSVAKRLKDLIVGSDITGYKNNNMTHDTLMPDDGAKNANGTVNENAKTLLEKVVLSNLGGLTGSFDFSGSEKMTEFRAMGTNIANIIFADGVQLKTLYLPKTITDLTLTEPTSLTGYLTTVAPKTEDDGSLTFPEGFYLEGITDVDTVAADTKTYLSKINIKGGEMGYSSYLITEKAIDIKNSMAEHWDEFSQEDKNNYKRVLSLNLEDVTWTPYRQVESGESVIAGASYVKKTDHYTFEAYNDYSSWDLDTLNGKIYQYTASNFESSITDLSLLDKIIASYESDEHYIGSTTQYADGRKSLPYISGNIYVKNTPENAIKELKIQYYNSYYPDLNIFVQNVSNDITIKYLSYDLNNTDKETEILSKKYASLEDAKADNPYNIEDLTATKANYDFKGWSINKSADGSISSEDWASQDMSKAQSSTDTSVYIYYSVFEIHKYKAYFYNTEEECNADLYDEAQKIARSRYGTYSETPYSASKAGLTAPDLTKFYPQKAYTGSVLDETSAWTGKWKISTDLNNTIDLNTIYPTDDFSFVADFDDKASVYDYPTDSSMFNGTYSSTYGGYLLSLKTNLTAELSGKITVPKIYIDNNGTEQKVVGLSNNAFGTSASALEVAQNITHIFWEDKSTIKRIGDYAFSNCGGLIYVEIPKVLETYNDIGTGAFKRCAKLLNGFAQEDIDKYFEKILYINGELFYGSISSITTLNLSGKITFLGPTAFRSCSKLANVNIGDDIDRVTLNSDNLGTRIFRDTATKTGTIKIYCADTNTYDTFYNSFMGSSEGIYNTGTKVWFSYINTEGNIVEEGPYTAP